MAIRRAAHFGIPVRAGTLGMSMPSADNPEMPEHRAHRDVVGAFSGHIVQQAGARNQVMTGAKTMGCALGVIGKAQVRTGEDFDVDPVAWRTLGAWLNTLETVLIETPARSATSSMVGRLGITGSPPVFAG